MPRYYTYLISSLPMLHFGRKPPFSFERFLQICRRVIPESDVNILKEASIAGEYLYETNRLTSRKSPSAITIKGDFRSGMAFILSYTIKKWRAFDTALRNELVKIRAARKRLDPLKYLRQDAYADPSITRIALNAYRNPSILEAERTLDQERWCVLDRLAVGHYFDIDFLIVYAHKLLILERWEKIHSADSLGILEEALK